MSRLEAAMPKNRKHPKWGGRRPNQTGRPPKPDALVALPVKVKQDTADRIYSAAKVGEDPSQHRSLGSVIDELAATHLPAPAKPYPARLKRR